MNKILTVVLVSVLFISMTPAGFASTKGVVNIVYVGSSDNWLSIVEAAKNYADDDIGAKHAWNWGSVEKVPRPENRMELANSYSRQSKYERRLFIYENLPGCGYAQTPKTTIEYAELKNAWIDVECIDHTAHELLHTLGAVHTDAPGSDGDWHSKYPQDIMYFDGGHGTLDTNGDSYWNPYPRRGTWLYENPTWNAAKSPFVTKDIQHRGEWHQPRTYEKQKYEKHNMHWSTR